MNLAETIKAKDFILLAEMETPKGVDISGFSESARRLKGRVDAVLIPDMDYAVMRLSALAGAVALKEQGLTSIIQFCCRDRNRLALQADLLGAHVLGVPNVMAVTGRPVETGDHLQARPVHDLDVNGFLEAVHCFSQGRDLAGKELKGDPRLCTGVRLEPWVDQTQANIRLEEAKSWVDKGAVFVITPPVFDLEVFSGLLERARDLGAPLIASVMLLKSVGMARYLNQNLPGVKIPEATITRIRQAKDRNNECIKIAAETINGLKHLCGGALIVTAGWENRLPQILDEAGL